MCYFTRASVNIAPTKMYGPQRGCWIYTSTASNKVKYVEAEVLKSVIRLKESGVGTVEL